MSPPEAEFIGPRGRNPAKVNLKIPAFGGALLMLCAVLVVTLFFVYNSCFVYIAPNEFGIKEVKIGMDTGIQKDVYGAGLQFRIPVLSQVHKLPRDVQVFELTGAQYEGREGVYVSDMANIQTSDGFFVDVDVSILYHIVDPYTVITKLGPGQRYLQQGVLPKAEPILKETLGQLTTEDFYNSPMRVEKQELARKMLDEELRDLGMEVERVLIRYFEYSEAIQQNIEDKKLQDQLVFTNQSKRKAAEQDQQLKRVTEEGEYHVKIALQEGDAYRVEKEAERDLYMRAKTAEADLLVKLAEAESTRLKNEALQTAGSSTLVAMEMTRLLDGIDTVIVPAGGASGLNPLDLSSVLTLFGIDSATVEAAAALPDADAEHVSSPLLQQLIEGAAQASEAIPIPPSEDLLTPEALPEAAPPSATPPPEAAPVEAAPIETTPADPSTTSAEVQQ